jgi:hypothetical protein
MDNKHQFIGALLETGDEVDSDNSSLSFNSSHISIVRLALWYLRRIDLIEERGEILLSCFNEPTSGLSIVESILEGDQEKRVRQDTDLLLSDAHFDALKSIFVNKLDTLAQDNPDDLIRHKQLSSVIWRWKRWGDEELVQTWLSEQAQKSEYCTILLQTFLRVGSSQSMGDYVARRTTQIDIESIEEFFPVEYLVTSLSQLNRDELNESEIEAIEAFEIAINQP